MTNEMHKKYKKKTQEKCKAESSHLRSRIYEKDIQTKI